MVKAKFRFKFSQGFTMTDRNKIQTKKGAEAFVRAHNSAPPRIRKQFGGKIIKIIPIKRR